MTTDREKIEEIAHILGDPIIYSRTIFLTVPAWGKRFKFNPAGEIIKVQKLTEAGNIITLSVDPEYESEEYERLQRKIKGVKK